MLSYKQIPFICCPQWLLYSAAEPEIRVCGACIISLSIKTNHLLSAYCEENIPRKRRAVPRVKLRPHSSNLHAMHLRAWSQPVATGMPSSFISDAKDHLKTQTILDPDKDRANLANSSGSGIDRRTRRDFCSYSKRIGLWRWHRTWQNRNRNRVYSRERVVREDWRTPLLFLSMPGEIIDPRQSSFSFKSSPCRQADRPHTGWLTDGKSGMLLTGLGICYNCTYWGSCRVL
jgi:hypothetical protein